MTFHKKYVVNLMELIMFKKINIQAIRDSVALLLIAAIVGTIVSFVAQLFIISAKNIYNFLFNNNEFIISIDIAQSGISLLIKAINLIYFSLSYPRFIDLSILLLPD